MDESCRSGSGLPVDRGVNLEACLEKRENIRIADRGGGIGGIM